MRKKEKERRRGIKKLERNPEILRYMHTERYVDTEDTERHRGNGEIEKESRSGLRIKFHYDYHHRCPSCAHTQSGLLG